MTQQEELQVLSPETSITLTTGETIELKPFKFGQLPKALKLAGSVVTIIQNAFASGDLTREIAKVLGDGGEDLIKLVALGTNKPREWFDELESDDGIKLTVAFIEVNMDFSTKKVLPLLKDGAEKMKKVKDADRGNLPQLSQNS